MKKIVIASAVAAAMASSAAVAETTFGGNIRLELQSREEIALDSGKLTFDIKASEDLGNGMTGIARIEYEHDNADFETGGITNDLSYVGLKGDFGQVTFGVQDDAVGFACGATDIFVNNSDVGCATGVTANGPLDNALVYANTFDAFTVVLGITLDGSLGDPVGTTFPDAVQVDGGQPAPGNHTVFAFQYDGGMWTIGAQMTDPDSDLDDLGADTATVIGGSVKLGPGTLGIALGDDGEDDAMDIAYAMPMAGGNVKIGVSQGDAMEDADGNDQIVNLQYDRKLSKAVYTGIQISDDDREEDALIEAWLGYKF